MIDRLERFHFLASAKMRVVRGMGLLVLLAMPAALCAAEKPITLGIEAEDFEYQGHWVAKTDTTGFSGPGILFAGPGGAKLPAATTINLPRAGRYQLWVRSKDFPDYRPGTRTFAVAINGKRATDVFGNSGREGWSWEPGGSFDLPAGKILLTLHDVSKNFGRCDAVLLTTDEKLEPSGKLGSGSLRRIQPVPLEGVVDQAADPLAGRVIKTAGSQPIAQLANEHVRYSFLPAMSEGRPTVIPRVEVRQGDRWTAVEADASAEIYSVVRTGEMQIQYEGVFPLWTLTDAKPIELKFGDITLQTAKTMTPPEIWEAGEFQRFTPVNAQRVGDAVRVDFAPTPIGQLVAQWRLPQGHKAASLKLLFAPSRPGSYSLGYHLFFRKPLAEVEELQLPLAFQRKRFPRKSFMVLDPRTPTPLSLAQTGKGAGAITWGVIGDPAEIPFDWPDREKPHMGFCIRDASGDVQPAIYGPVPGTPQAKIETKKTLAFQCNVLVQPGEWYAGYRTAADEVFGLRDYRRNGPISLSDAVLNMIDLVKDDEFGGWWRDAKGWYQIESHNTVTHSTPATLLSLYRLTGDDDLYRRRALPTMEYVLSRDSVHFTPEPKDPGRYSTGPMNGPVRYFGSSTFTAMARLAEGRTPAFEKIALPAEEKVRRTVGYAHAEAFNEWGARYRMTGDKGDLQEAIRLADEYLEKRVITAPTVPIGHQPFWLISFVPDWEGLLMMYELTGEKRFLDGAVIGARQLMTGLWTQPTFPAGKTTIFPGGEYDGDPWGGHLLARGPYESRLGFPLRRDSLAEHVAPAWQVSCVGLGFEQPSTLGGKRNRLIYQAVWAPEFLRLARYTGDKAFETYARNATVGRWSNYPGYYVCGHNDLLQNPAYPFVGPDQSVIYYHHIVPHLSWTLDYLVADAELLSQGKVEFPWLRENGYAYFDGKVFGHEPGKIFDETGCWLWLQRGAAVVSNPQINSLTAHNAKKFFAVLTNQDTQPQSASITLSQQALGIDPKQVTSITVRRLGGAKRVELKDGVAQLEFGPRELLVVEVEGVRIDIPAHRSVGKPAPGKYPTELAVKAGDVTIKGAAIAVAPGPWNAYIWCDATEDQAQSVALQIPQNGAVKSQVDTDYPFEFSVPVSTATEPLRFRVVWKDHSGKEFRSEELTLGSADAAQK